MDFTFNPTIEVVNKTNGIATQEQIHDEPMLFSAHPEFAAERGGPLTIAALKMLCYHLPKVATEGKHLVIDTRSHMLMPGMYPAIGGWHCDAVARSDYNAQPDLSKMDGAKHWVMTLSTHPEGVSRTEFITQDYTAKDIDKDLVWGSVSRGIGNGDNLDKMLLKDGELLMFTSSTLHRAMPATRRGWRWFFRCSEYHSKPQNKIRKQVQVYTDISGGW